MQEIREYVEEMASEAEDLITLAGFVMAAANEVDFHFSGAEYDKLRVRILNSLNYILSLMEQHSEKYGKLFSMVYQMEQTMKPEAVG